MTPIVIDEGLFPNVLLREAAQDFAALPADRMTEYADPDFEYGKRTMNDLSQMPSGLRYVIESAMTPAFVRHLEYRTGLKDLVTDSGLWGGGAHVTMPGGYLAMHRDFNVLPTSYRDAVPLRRVLNLIVYLTEGWSHGWGGELEIENRNGSDIDVRTISPLFGRAVLFDPSETFHGHPHPYRGPVPRQSIAVYYYVRERVPQSQWRSTEYLSLPWKKDTLEAQKKRMERSFARLRYAKWWPQDGWDANGSPA